MAYFSNGTEGMEYETAYCDKCVHQHKEWGCPCWAAHLSWNYDESHNKESILHKMIPRSKDGLSNAQCFAFTPRAHPSDKTNELLAEAITEAVSKWLEDYTQDKSFYSINVKGAIYSAAKDVLDEGVEVIL